MRTAFCTVKIECSLKNESTTREWGELRKKIAYHLMDLPECRVKFFGWEAPSPELYEADVLPMSRRGGDVDEDTLPPGTIVQSDKGRTWDHDKGKS